MAIMAMKNLFIEAENGRVDDLPLLHGMLKKMGVQKSIDEVIEVHGNWQGLSPGWVITVWLMHILHEKNHLMEPLENRVEKHLRLLRRITKQDVESKNFTDDRLALCPKHLSQSATWFKIEKGLGLNLIRVLNRQIDTEINWDNIGDLGLIGVDEISRSKGHKKFSAIISSRQANGKMRIFGVLPDRKKTVKEFLGLIPAKLRPTIKHFTTAMWEGYINAINEFIAEHDDVTAYPVIDRFHVAQNYREDFDDLRKKELKGLKKELPAETYD